MIVEKSAVNVKELTKNVPAKRPIKQKKYGGTALTGWLFVIPATLLITLFVFYPMLQSFILSQKTGAGTNLPDRAGARHDRARHVYRGAPQRQETSGKIFFPHGDFPSVRHLARFLFADYEEHLCRQRHHEQISRLVQRRTDPLVYRFLLVESAHHHLHHVEMDGI